MNTPFFKARPLAPAVAALLSCSSTFISTPAKAQDLPPLLVTGQPTTSLTTELNPTSSQRLTADTGEWLSQQNGISTNRMGGHGLDPVIRGLGQNRLNILLDGAYVFGGCPNRMDPPTAYAPLTSYDLVTISKGVTTLRHGAGGSGGTVVFERLQPDFSAGNSAISGQLGGSYASNGNAAKGWGSVLAGGEQGYVRAFGEYSEARDYKDGGGRKIWSGYESTQGGGALGWTPNAASWFEISYEETRERDVKFAGAGMDSPTSDNKTYGLRGRYDLSPLLTLTGNLNYSQVEHLMDNYSLRPKAMMQMVVPTTSDTLTGRLMAEYELGPNQFAGGINLLENQRSATQIRSPKTSPKYLEFMWPDVTQRQIGAFAEVEHHLGANRRVSTGIRADYFESKADLANSKPADGMIPAAIYNTTYGITGDLDRDKWLTGAFMRFEQDLGKWQRAFVSVSRSQRMGDATEMYMARDNWVGNPDLKPETSHQVDLGLMGKSKSIDYSAVVFSNQVTDYIYRDVNSGKSTYRNIKAALYGLELESTLRYAVNWETRGQLNLLRGDNRSDSGTLSQIAPYSGQVSQHWINDQWEAAATFRFADESDRLNSDAKEQATAGYGLLDLSLAWKPIEEFTVSTGINNLLDKNYANFLNRNAAGSDPLNMGTSAWKDTLTEPGRSFWVSGNYHF
ncbi:TonB-dependent receptor domain-containing protein [Marinospirillum insulare]|uniref:TonB-dependent receptor n=1 Tax=Marinospirillum insulare TaxID=217169 RepID=A0ABQ5ZT75_9GAMM|nr:TonB-dependent receptor [Marinospirillum insulare]GLR63336.1 TonB-dependent receptor [Marinospirillum insulare]